VYTNADIAVCHREAIDYVLTYAEAHVFHSRSGASGIVEEDVTGVIAASFTHFTSRLDDPQLHDHVVVWNRTRSVSDGKWRTLDSKAIFKATTTLSELHQGVLSDLLTAKLGVGWEARGPGSPSRSGPSSRVVPSRSPSTQSSSGQSSKPPMDGALRPSRT
jgi:conjugative relaxase-like TrwC/TraI family protein